ncbi:addiction module antidote protein [Paraburkholderia aspalathi]|uniref:addiction module antidote protein n=1 Tax=Paraburkholderia aspalathi TaxID=1324617 RepID=UPI0038BD4EC3
MAADLITVLEENALTLLAAAVGDIACARGMSQVAEDSGIACEALCEALRPGGEPRFETISRVCAALGVRPGRAADASGSLTDFRRFRRASVRDAARDADIVVRGLWQEARILV